MHKNTFMLLPADISAMAPHCPWSKPTLVTGLPNPVGPVLANSSLTIGSSFYFRASWILMHLTLPHPCHTPTPPLPLCSLSPRSLLSLVSHFFPKDQLRQLSLQTRFGSQALGSAGPQGSYRSPSAAGSTPCLLACPYCLPSCRFAKLLLRLPALRSIGLKCLEHLFFFKLIGDTPIDTFLMEMLEAPHQAT